MPFRPWEDSQRSLRSVQDEMNRLVERVWHGGLSTAPFDGQQWAPPVDLYDQPDHFTLFAEVPGVDAETIEVTYLGSALTLRGQKLAPSAVNEETRSLHDERRFGAFCRTIELPSGIDAEKLSAKCANGVLEITIPKTEASKPKSVKIRIEES